MKRFISIVAFIIPAFVASAQQKVTDKDLQTVYQYMTGSFSSQEQSKSDTNYFDIRLHMKPIWKNKKGEYWLYVEQAMAAKMEKPYRQRVYCLSLINDTTIASKVYSFKGDPLRYAGVWKKASPLDGFSLDSLEAREGCIIYLHKIGKGIYEGGTRANDCVSNLRGASYATSEAHITKIGLKTWDRGYDKDGKQVWGAVKGGYDFRKVKR